MAVLILIACFFALPVGIWIGYRAGRVAGKQEFLDRMEQTTREIERMRERVQSTLLRARPAAPAQHTTH